MKFILQKDDVTQIEKQVVRAAAFTNNWNTTSEYLNDICKLDKIHSDRFSTPVGTVEFVQAYAKHFNMSIPYFDSYPACLYDYLGRTIIKSTFELVDDAKFVKPIEVKKFTGGIKSNITEIVDKNTPVYVSDKVKFVAEWRVYILSGKNVGMGRYDDNEDESLSPSTTVIEKSIKLMNDNISVAGYSLDFGLTDDNRTLLVEANDGWAIGFYKGTCSYATYATLLQRRWNDIIIHNQ